MGVALYGPAVALNLVTPLSITASVFLCGGICTIYTGWFFCPFYSVKGFALSCQVGYFVLYACWLADQD